MTEKAPSQPILNPDPPRREQNASFIKFAFITVTLLLACYGLQQLHGMGKKAYDLAVFSHASMYANETGSQVTNWSDVVRPLVDNEQRFDLALSVWTPRYQEGSDKLQTNELSNSWNRSNEFYTFIAKYRQMDKKEKVIFSDIVFKGLTLNDKHVFADVNLSIPTAYFRRSNDSSDKAPGFHPSDLRASVVLIPTSPSPLDTLKNVSTFYPFWVQRPRFISYPFPLGSENYDHTLKDDAIESFGVQFPMLSIVDVPTNCSPFSQVHQPFIMTRTHLRIATETHLFNASLYNQAHENLQQKFYYQGGVPKILFMDWDIVSRAGLRTYKTRGNQEVRLQLEDGSYAYGPYMSRFNGPVAAKDMVKAPIWDPCSSDEEQESSDFINITYHLTYSGRSPAKMILGEHWDFDAIYPNRHDAAASEAMELLNGLYGHRAENAHPRRRFVAMVISLTVDTAQWLLTLQYWYTCTSTASLSIPGFTMVAAADLIDAFIHIVARAEQNNVQGVGHWIWFLAQKIVTQLLAPILILKAVWRIEAAPLLRLRRAPATHAERASERVDSRMALIRIGTLAFSAITAYLLPLNDIFLVPPTTPIPLSWKDFPYRHPLVRLVGKPLRWTGQMSQWTLNHQRGSFAGSYKTALFLVFILWLEDLSHVVPSIMGEIRHWGVSVSAVVSMLVLMLGGYQAVRLPSYEMKENETKE